MNSVTLDSLRSRICGIDTMPVIPIILRPLLRCLDQPVEQIDVNRIVELVSYDKSLAALCVRMANSALFGRATPVESVRTAVLSLGISRVREMLFSKSFSQVIPARRWIVEPSVFWRHSLGCALLCRKFAEIVGYSDPEKAYLAGLLHDIGILVNSMILHSEFRTTYEKASREHIPLDEAEQATLGFTHSDSGRILAESWNIPHDLREVIELHHEIGDSERGGQLVAMVHLSDVLCRSNDLGYGYFETPQMEFTDEPGWMYLVMQFPKLTERDLARFAFALEENVKSVSKLVSSVFAG